jgi:hypothetical protein
MSFRFVVATLALAGIVACNNGPDRTGDVANFVGDPTNGGGGGAGPCKAYLSCLLQTSPSAYAPALELYGANAACWDNAAQSTACDAACSDALSKITECSCAGPVCTAAPMIASGSYDVSAKLVPTVSLCPTLTSSGQAGVTASGAHGEISGLVVVNQFGNTPYVSSYSATFDMSANGLMATWTVEGYLVGSSPLTPDSTSHFESTVDWMGDQSCVYHLDFTQR